MFPLKYYTIMRESKDPRWIRYEMVRYARDNGVKSAARIFNTTPKTVRKWLRRGQPSSLRGLEDQSKAPPRAKGLVSIQIKDKRLLN